MKKRDEVRTMLIEDKDARVLSKRMKYCIHSRPGHVYTLFNPPNAIIELNECSDDEKNYRESKKALLFHCACIFDICECTLD